jgi:hypothetical protein
MEKLKTAGELVENRFHYRVVKPHPKIKAIY